MQDMARKKNASLIIALSVPVVMVILVALAIYIPGMFYAPTYDFVYSTSDWNVYRLAVVREGKIVLEEPPYVDEKIPPSDPIIFRYDIETNTASEISLEEAEQLTLDGAQFSPDGYEITRGGNGGIFDIFGPNDSYNTWYIRGRSAGKRLNISNNNDYYYNFRFVGWILP